MMKITLFVAGLVTFGVFALNTAYAQTTTPTVTPTTTATVTPTGSTTTTPTPQATGTPAVLGAPNTGYGSIGR